MPRTKHSRHGVRLKQLNASGQHPSGNTRYYFRPKGKNGIALPDAPRDSPIFMAKYYECLTAYEGTNDLSGPQTYKTGSLGLVIGDFIASKPFKRYSQATQQQHTRHLHSIRDTPEPNGADRGTAKFEDITDYHIKIDLSPYDGHPYNNRLKAWRALYKWAHRKPKTGAQGKNYALMVKSCPTGKAIGAIPWKQAEVDQFRAHWPLETPQRLAMELFHRTAADAVDVAKMGPSMVGENGYMVFQRSKTDETALVPFRNAPSWSEPTDHFERCYAAQNRAHLTHYIVTAYGKPRSHKAFSSWFSDACTKAGLPHLSAKGLRKHRSTRFKENGASRDQRQAWLGQESESVDSIYTKTADGIKVIESSN